MKYLNIKSILIVLSFIALPQIELCAEGAPYPIAQASTENIYVFEKINGAVPSSVVTPYEAERQAGDIYIVYKNENGNKVEQYRITPPQIAEIDTTLDRGFKGFDHAVVIANGDLLLRYYGVNFVYYSKENQNYTVLPLAINSNGEMFATNSWTTFSTGLLACSCSDGKSLMIYDLINKKTHVVGLPSVNPDSLRMINLLDESQGICEIKTYVLDTVASEEEEHKYQAASGDIDTKVVGSLGWYKLVKH